MASQIITLGIGPGNSNLTPFITTGLEIGAAVVITSNATVYGPTNTGYVKGPKETGVVKGTK